MNRVMVNIAKVNTTEIAEETKLPAEAVEKVIQQIIANKSNHKRELKPPAPVGGIAIRSAARIYKIHSATISRWVTRGLIPILLRTKNEVYIDESVIKEIAKRYKASPGRGKRTIVANNEKI